MRDSAIQEQGMAQRKSREERARDELRFEPFTLLAAVAMAFVVAAAITYAVVYSDTEPEVWSHAVISSIVSLLAIVGFAAVRRREARRPFSLRIRRKAWQAMLVGYIVATGAVLVITLVSHRLRWSDVVVLRAWLCAGLIMGFTLWQLIRSSARAN
jgi:hypothetical protein